ncbi:MAG: hypothetical protein GQ540_08450 [Lutibacter sp.]|uniref:hypothetical protein n=1 Tax=Lutibacter sp. TaxID=1925666 RepID=UPI0019F23BE8|nr:hypothetical protein [Lutibacter sp.]NOR28544.1 hypothetical protein [Lutibacter sp.]
MKKPQLILLITLLTYSTVFSQKGNSINNAISDISDVFRYKNPTSNYKNYEGDPYFNNQFILGTINNTNAKKIYSYQMRYNVYEDKIEIQKEDKSIVYLAKATNFNVLILGKTFVLKTYEDKGENNEGYLELLLNKSNIELYKKHKRTLISAKKAKSSYEEDKLARFNSSESFYYKLGNSKVLLLPKSKKDFLKSFSDKSNDIASFMKHNKLKKSKKEDIIKILEYYSTLK